MKSEVLCIVDPARVDVELARKNLIFVLHAILQLKSKNQADVYVQMGNIYLQVANVKSVWKIVKFVLMHLAVKNVLLYMYGIKTSVF